MIQWFWDWGTLILYLLIGVGLGRIAARAAYRYTRKEWKTLATEAKFGLGEAITVFAVTLFLWPLVGLWLTFRFMVTRSLPEYRAARNKELSAELDLKIKQQQAEIARLDREIKDWRKP